jgi:Kef-type K+ transport system membrane component KefB
MNLLLIIGFLVITGYFLGRMLDKIGIPKIIGYILTGIIFSPNSVDWIPQQIISDTNTLLSVSLAFIAFEVGGELKWQMIQRLEKEIVSITLMAGFIPLILITGCFYLAGLLYPDFVPFSAGESTLVFAILLAALASPTDPTATLAVIHQIPAAFIPILFFVILRFTGKYLGSYLGGSLIKTKPAIKKYTAGGLIPQGGIVIGLALMVNQYSEFSELFDLLLTVVMGGVIINELIGPLTAKHSLLKAKESTS